MHNFIEKVVNISSLISYKGASYGVPKTYINKKVFLKEEKNLIFIYSNKLEFIAVYEIKESGIHYSKGLYDLAKMKQKNISTNV